MEDKNVMQETQLQLQMSVWHSNIGVFKLNFRLACISAYVVNKSTDLLLDDTFNIQSELK